MIYLFNRGACGLMAIVVGNGHTNQCSKPGQGCLHFTKW